MLTSLLLLFGGFIVAQSTASQFVDCRNKFQGLQSYMTTIDQSPWMVTLLGQAAKNSTWNSPLRDVDKKMLQRRFGEVTAKARASLISFNTRLTSSPDYALCLFSKDSANCIKGFAERIAGLNSEATTVLHTFNDLKSEMMPAAQIEMIQISLSNLDRFLVMFKAMQTTVDDMYQTGEWLNLAYIIASGGHLPDYLL